MNTRNQQFIQYHEDFIYNMRFSVRRQLPDSVFSILNNNSKIRTKLNDRDLKIFNRVLDNFNPEELKKKINGLLNKLTGQNIDIIYQQMTEILKNREVLINHTISRLIQSAMNLQTRPTSEETMNNLKVYVELYKKMYNDETKEIFNKVFNNVLETIKGVKNSNTEQLEKYMKDKTRFNNLLVFMATLYQSGIVSCKYIKENIKYLEITILKSEEEENNKYCEGYKLLLTTLNKKEFFNIKKMEELKKKSKLNMRCKFMFMDLKDIHKKI